MYIYVRGDLEVISDIFGQMIYHCQLGFDNTLWQVIDRRLICSCWMRLICGTVIGRDHRRGVEEARLTR
jgi:hypothetical protein